MQGNKIFITGGAGFLGRAFIEKYNKNNHIIVYSRDEAKHYLLKKQYPNVEFVVGDIKDLDRMLDVSRGCDYGVFAASMKQIEAVDENPDEANNVIINGAINSRKVVERNLKSGCFISSDKSRNPTTLYGAMKFVAGECFLNSRNKDINLSSLIYGNVLNSTGSIIPLIWNSIKKNTPLPLYGENMTRFMITSDQAIKSIKYCLENKENSFCHYIPFLKSFRVLDLFEIYKEKFGLRYFLKEARKLEKTHEILFTSEEASRLKVYNPSVLGFKMGFLNNNESPLIPQPGEEFKDYSSELQLVSKSKLDDLLKKNDYFVS